MSRLWCALHAPPPRSSPQLESAAPPVWTGRVATAAQPAPAVTLPSDRIFWNCAHSFSCALRVFGVRPKCSRPAARVFSYLADMSRSCLLCLAFVISTAMAGRSVPAVGDVLEFGERNPTYLQKDTQVVGVIPTFSSSRRMLDRKANVFYGPSRRKGIMWYSKKRKWNPFRSSQREPFKVRLLKVSPAGLLLTLAEEEKLELREEKSKTANNMLLSVKLAKPKPWWRII